jgi:hypothetical protein
MRKVGQVDENLLDNYEADCSEVAGKLGVYPLYSLTINTSNPSYTPAVISALQQWFITYATAFEGSWFANDSEVRTKVVAGSAGGASIAVLGIWPGKASSSNKASRDLGFNRVTPSGTINPVKLEIGGLFRPVRNALHSLPKRYDNNGNVNPNGVWTLSSADVSVNASDSLLSDFDYERLSSTFYADVEVNVFQKLLIDPSGCLIAGQERRVVSTYSEFDSFSLAARFVSVVLGFMLPELGTAFDVFWAFVAQSGQVSSSTVQQLRAKAVTVCGLVASICPTEILLPSISRSATMKYGSFSFDGYATGRYKGPRTNRILTFKTGPVFEGKFNII